MSSLEAEVQAARQDPRRRFGPFLLLSELGRGGMGVVARAFDERLGRVVALKTILVDAAGCSEDAVLRFEREARSAARLRHPGIVQVYETGTTGNARYLVMELLEGKTLGRAADALGRRRAVEVVRDVARAVQHAHEQGVLHRDLKPENVMVTTDGRAVVMDFGLARAAGELTITKTGVALGTPAYMSPEQAGGGGTVDRRTDVYALGAILYRVLAGRPPFEGSTEVNVIASVLTKAPEPPSRLAPDVEPELEAVALACLEKDPGRRPPTAKAFADELDRWLLGVPVRARPRGRLARLGGGLGKHPLLAAAAGAAFLALAGAGAVLAARRLPAFDAAAEAERKARARREEAAAAALDGLSGDLESQGERDASLARARRAVEAAGAVPALAARLGALEGEGAWLRNDTPRALEILSTARLLESTLPAGPRPSALLAALLEAERGDARGALESEALAAERSRLPARALLARSLALARVDRGTEALPLLAAAEAKLGPVDALRAAAVLRSAGEHALAGARLASLPEERLLPEHAVPLAKHAAREARGKAPLEQVSRLVDVATRLAKKRLAPEVRRELAQAALARAEAEVAAVHAAVKDELQQVRKSFPILRPWCEWARRLDRGVPPPRVVGFEASTFWRVVNAEFGGARPDVEAAALRIAYDALPEERAILLAEVGKVASASEKAFYAGKLPLEKAAPILECVFGLAEVRGAGGALVHLYIHAGRPGDALAAADRLLSLDPEATDVLVKKAVALRELHRGPEARAVLDGAIARDPACFDAYHERGRLLLDAPDSTPQDLEQSRSDFRQILEGAPRDYWVAKGSTEMLVAVELRRGRTAEALEASSRVPLPGSRWYRGLHAKVLLRAGRQEDAVRYLEAQARELPAEKWASWAARARAARGAKELEALAGEVE